MGLLLASLLGARANSMYCCSDDDEDTVKEHRVFKVNIVQFQVTNQGVPNLFGAEDIVTTMLPPPPPPVTAASAAAAAVQQRRC